MNYITTFNNVTLALGIAYVLTYVGFAIASRWFRKEVSQFKYTSTIIAVVVFNIGWLIGLGVACWYDLPAVSTFMFYVTILSFVAVGGFHYLHSRHRDDVLPEDEIVKSMIDLSGMTGRQN